MHFEELWEKCEKTHIGESNMDSILDELAMKINLYRILSEKKEIPDAELQKIKSRTIGEILFTLTNLSLKDNINVFDALSKAQQFHSEKNYEKIPVNLRLPLKLKP